MFDFAVKGNPANFQSLRGLGDIPPMMHENPLDMLFLVLS
jgi:hypothetical protein